MTRAQVENLVERRQVSASLLESLEVEGYARAADWVYRTASEYAGVPIAVVAEIHRHAVSLAWQVEPPPTHDSPGAWRNGGVRVRSVRVSLPAAIHADLSTWSASSADRGATHPVVHAAIHHAWFERIHPFVDANGRVGRLILNFILVQHGYPPAVILASQRRRYLQALRIADGGNPNPLAEVIARAVSSTLSRFLIPKLAGEAKLVPLSALAAQSPYSSAYLRLLVITGKLRAIRDGHLWLSSRAWLADYMRGRDPRGGRPRNERTAMRPRGRPDRAWRSP
jgi:hypothetical protein